MLTYGLPVVYVYVYIYLYIFVIFSLKYYKKHKHGRKAKSVIDKCWKHLSAKLTLRYSYIYVVEHYDKY